MRNCPFRKDAVLGVCRSEHILDECSALDVYLMLHEFHAGIILEIICFFRLIAEKLNV